jgi:hypothetical protein
MTLVDALGRTAYTREGSANASEHVTITLDADAVATGTYRCEVRMGQWRAVRALGRW